MVYALFFERLMSLAYNDYFNISVDVVGKNVLKNNFYVPVFLIVIICGILICVCCVMVIFIVYRLATKEILNGNLILTIVFVLANLFTLLTALPFCVTDDYFGAENLNAWKILLITLAFGLTFSIMLSRTLFLALSTGGDFIIHINGYLQSLMALFAFGVQIAMSVMYFVLSTMNSAVVIRSLIFIALLGILTGLFINFSLIPESSKWIIFLLEKNNLCSLPYSDFYISLEDSLIFYVLLYRINYYIVLILILFMRFLSTFRYI